MTAKGETWRRGAVVILGTTAVGALLVSGAALLPFRRSELPIPQVTIEAGLVELPAPPAPSPPSPAPAVTPPPPSPPMSPTEPKLSQRRHPRPVLQPKPLVRASPPTATASPPRAEPPPTTETEDKQLSGGTSGARAIVQPMPVIPPELRRHTLDLVAVVRFSIAADGSARAELEEATPDPRLNQVLLDTFQHWRFFPALEHGQPVASTLVLRVPITVE